MRKERLDDFLQDTPQLRTAVGERLYGLAENNRQFPYERHRHGDSADHAQNFEFAPLVRLDVEQHDDKKEQDHNGPGVYQYLDGRDEQGLQQEEEPGHEHEQQDKEHRARDGIAVEDHQKTARQHRDAKKPK